MFIYLSIAQPQVHGSSCPRAVQVFFFFFFFFFMNGNTERAECAVSRVCIPWKKEKKCNKTSMLISFFDHHSVCSTVPSWLINKFFLCIIFPFLLFFFFIPCVSMFFLVSLYLLHCASSETKFVFENFCLSVFVVCQFFLFFFFSSSYMTAVQDKRVSCVHNYFWVDDSSLSFVKILIILAPSVVSKIIHMS